jgi:hypothetical protein
MPVPASTLTNITNKALGYFRVSDLSEITLMYIPLCPFSIIKSHQTPV